MKDYTQLKHHLNAATELLTDINEEAQKLPDRGELPEIGTPTYDILQSLIQGFVEFKPHYDTCYEPFKGVVEGILKENGKTQESH